MSRPNCSDSASASTRRIRDSSTVWVNSLGAASTAVSSTSPSGRVRLSIAFCCGDRLVASRSRIWSQTVARSSVAVGHAVSSLPVSCRRSRSLVRPRRCPGTAVQVPVDPPSGPQCGRRGRAASTSVSTGCARSATDAAGPVRRSGTDRRRCRSEAAEREIRAVRRSVDRRGRPAHRDPVVQRGATATLTAPSTARQRRLPARPGASAPACRPRADGVAGWTMSGRDPPGLRRERPRLCWRSLWRSVSLATLRGSRAVRAACRSAGPASGVSGCGPSPSVPVAPRARPPGVRTARCRSSGSTS